MSARVIQCPSCQTQLRVPAAAAKIQCPKCQTLLNLKAPAAAASAAPQRPAPQNAAPPTFGSQPPAAAAPGTTPQPFRSTFAPPTPGSGGPAGAKPSAAGGDSAGKSKLLWVLIGSGAALVVLCLLIGAGVAAYMMLSNQPSEPTVANNTAAGSSSATASPPAATAPLPDSWEAAEVLAAAAQFPPGAVRRSKTDQRGIHRVVSAQTSAVYELQVFVQSPPGDEPLTALQSLTADRTDGPHRWEPISRDGHDGFRSASPQGSAAPKRILEAYPHPDGWVLVSYQAFSSRDAAERPAREMQEDEAELDLPESFVASLSLPAQFPASTQAMNTQPQFHKLSEAEKKQLYKLYKVAYQQANQKIKIPRGPARTRTENMLAAVLASEIKKLAAMFDCSEAEVRSIGAEGRALGW